MAKVMMNIRWLGPKPSLDDIRARLGIAEGMLDQTFGVIATAPEAHIYTVLIEESEAARLTSGDHAEVVQGPFSRG